MTGAVAVGGGSVAVLVNAPRVPSASSLVELETPRVIVEAIRDPFATENLLGAPVDALLSIRETS